MPLYEYLCSACANRFERIVKFSDPPLKTCPQCGRDTIEQMISAPAVQFKGSGWYVTDYAHKSSSQGSSSPAKSDSVAETVAASKESGNGAANGSGSKEKAPATSAPKSATGNSSAGSSAT